ncbi:MAG: hypothetical protein LCH36_03220 [Actinobacteria bacterium]|nr:hypothetical protein [Actinomycetota bacterium]
MTSPQASVRADAHALQRVRGVLRSRERPTSGDVAYRTYFAVMLAVVVAAPAVRMLLLWLVEVLPAVNAAQPLVAVSLTGPVPTLFVALIVLGWYAMPVRISLPELDLLFTTGLPRWRLVIGRVVRQSAALMLAGVSIGAVLLGAWAMRGEVLGTAVAPVLAVGAALGLLASLCLLLGQSLHGTRWQTMRAQAQQLDVVSALVMTGDFRSAAGRIGAPVSLGRRWRWAAAWGKNTPGWWLIASRDLLGIVRTPMRSLAALAGVLLGGVLLPAAPTVPAFSGLSALALPVVYAAIGPWCRGLRVAGESVGAIPLLPFASTGHLLRHLIVPTALACIASGVAAGIAAGLLECAIAPVFAALVAGVTVALFAITLRLLGSLKGPLPQRLLAPVPTPAGDLSSINVLLWNLDGPALAAGIGIALVLLATGAPTALPVVAAVLLALLLGWCALRLRAAEER